MRENYHEWLEDQKYSSNTQVAQIHRVRKVEDSYGDLDKHYQDGTILDVIQNLQYSMHDERSNKPNPSKIVFDGNIRNNLQSYKNATVRYLKFLDQSTDEASTQINKLSEHFHQDDSLTDEKQQKLSLERDMQFALRNNISNLSNNLKIIDDGAERAVDSGLIDITCEDDDTIIVIELKAGKADSRAIGQILGYMGDLQEECEKPVRGILVAHDFDKRSKAAARVVPTLTLKKYSIEFQFQDID